jgi:Tol biopolymer transport system component
LLVTELNRGTTDDISLLTMDKRQMAPLIQTPFVEREAEVSPDGRWVAYESFESGTPQIYVRPFPDVNSGRWQISTGRGRKPVWAPSGRELFYLVPAADASSGLYAVTIQTTPSFSFSTGSKSSRPSWAASKLEVRSLKSEVSRSHPHHVL